MNPNRIKFGLVGFIDLLGFSARLDQIKSTQDFSELERELSVVQNRFDHAPPDHIIRESQRAIAKTVLAFSDCVVIHVPTKSPLARLDGNFDILMSELYSFALAQGDCVTRSIFLRGGCDFGTWYRRRDTLISPALAKAYRLEHSASVPMIAITEEFYKFLASHPHRQFYSSDIEPVQKLLKKFSDLPNQESHWFIDYMPSYLESIDVVFYGEERKTYQAAKDHIKNRMRQTAYLKNCKGWAVSHARAIRRALKNAEGTAARKKYEWLAEYHEDCCAKFFGKRIRKLSV